MKIFRTLPLGPLAFLGVLPLLAGCIEILGAGAGAAGVAVIQERSVGHAIDDSGINLAITGKFLEASPTLFKSVDAHVVEGRVSLTGSVKNPDDRVEAARLVWQVAGVREVQNEVQVENKSGFADYASDVRITTAIVSKLLFERNVSQINYTIETVNGVVYVMGIARDAAERDLVIQIARTTGAVKRVVNHALLKDDPRRR
jgi:osmotically-inducible protein OsmY